MKGGGMCETPVRGKIKKHCLIKTFFAKTLDKNRPCDYNTNVADARVAELADALA